MSRKGDSFLNDFVHIWVCVAVLLLGLALLGTLVSVLLTVLVPAAIIAVPLVLIARSRGKKRVERLKK